MPQPLRVLQVLTLLRGCRAYISEKSVKNTLNPENILRSHARRVVHMATKQCGDALPAGRSATT
jgi:hypothetical protein